MKYQAIIHFTNNDVKTIENLNEIDKMAMLNVTTNYMSVHEVFMNIGNITYIEFEEVSNE